MNLKHICNFYNVKHLKKKKKKDANALKSEPYLWYLFFVPGQIIMSHRYPFSTARPAGIVVKREVFFLLKVIICCVCTVYVIIIVGRNSKSINNTSIVMGLDFAHYYTSTTFWLLSLIYK